MKAGDKVTYKSSFKTSFKTSKKYTTNVLEVVSVKKITEKSGRTYSTCTLSNGDKVGSMWLKYVD